MVVTYLGNRMVTWRERSTSTDSRRQITLFIVFNLIGLGISVVLLLLTHDVLGLTSRLADNLSATWSVSGSGRCSVTGRTDGSCSAPLVARLCRPRVRRQPGRSPSDRFARPDGTR
ncbi:MAG: GtrA family protein [Nocardioides sp.]|jgi:hypothetical protein|nr:GtrA family protein [Nocardioides sp.]